MSIGEGRGGAGGMAMRTLMSSGEVPVAYGQIYVESQINQFADLADCFEGQENGLCGAAVEGRLFLITGLHTGVVAFTVELHDAEPPVDDSWEDVVEVSFRPRGVTTLECWSGQTRWRLDLDEIDYRVRYSSKGRDAAADDGERWAGDPEIDSYLLQFWPRTPGPSGRAQPDRVVKQGSDSAAYWHAYARKQPLPSPLDVPASVSEAVAQAGPGLRRRRFVP